MDSQCCHNHCLCQFEHGLLLLLQLIAEVFELDVVLPKKIKVLQNRTIIKSVSSPIADSTWSGRVNCIVPGDCIDIIGYNVVKCIANFIWYVNACRIFTVIGTLLGGSRGGFGL